MATSKQFEHLDSRFKKLVDKYLDPIINEENNALSNSTELPDPDFDSIAAFRLLIHAELEGYFEDKATHVIEELNAQFKSDKFINSKISSLIMLYLWRTQSTPTWSGSENLPSDFKRLAEEALGFGRKFIKSNNGIKENSIHTLSAIIGLYQHEIDEILIEELNEFGKKRGAVAHKSWIYNTRTFRSAEDEKNTVKNIIKLIKDTYEREDPVEIISSTTLRAETVVPAPTTTTAADTTPTLSWSDYITDHKIDSKE
ncbi:TPA: hypothetical protein ONA42_004810 [Pseudomonas aeruginosa]|uniref:HEPN domain-containing protein n=1 Tax=Pseudomonas aeruginosa TaxID=287 RepID=UPI0029C01072|nr:HEPN domain-containing protein [Pseudomonas aeruginosa]HCR1248452.1 hypothetical protein [Pseudomonas aeruginosa]HCR1436301.1 hypothetical protein [Pseudomonas aeruginosa]